MMRHSFKMAVLALITIPLAVGCTDTPADTAPPEPTCEELVTTLDPDLDCSDRAGIYEGIYQGDEIDYDSGDFGFFLTGNCFAVGEVCSELDELCYDLEGFVSGDLVYLEFEYESGSACWIGEFGPESVSGTTVAGDETGIFGGLFIPEPR